jgi:hypothetical protein
VSRQPGRIISEDQAAEVWRRAAELQAATDEPPAGAFPPDASEHGGGFPVAEVESAAVRAGIGAEFVRRALAELPREGREESVGVRAAELLLGRRPRRMDASRVMDAPPADVLSALQRVLPAHPYRLALADSEGDPLSGGTLVFELLPEPQGAGSRLRFASAAGARLLRLTLLPAPDGRSCEARIEAELRPTLGEQNTDATVTAGFAGLGGGLFAAFGAAKLLLMAGAVLLLPAAGGALAAGAAGLAGFRVHYRSVVRRAGGELEAMLAAVNAHLRTGGAFPLPAPPEGGSSAGDAATVIVTRV